MNDFREYSAAFHAQNDEILHFGILGMKWGIRRFQNEDGSLTPAGEKRYNNNAKFRKKVDKDEKFNNWKKKQEEYEKYLNDREKYRQTHVAEERY